MTCNQCLHRELCNVHGYIDADECGCYKDKSRYIELPCAVGDTVYLIPKYNGKPYCGVVEDKIQMIGITSRGVHIKARNHHDHNKTYFLGKTVFLTKEEAEQALKGGVQK